MFGTSVAWQDVLKRAARVAATEATTCLEGESGTGKEVVARFIHSQSPRRRGPFVAINCAALPSSCSNRSCSDSSAAPLPARSRPSPDRSSWRREACCFSTK